MSDEVAAPVEQKAPENSETSAPAATTTTTITAAAPAAASTTASADAAAAADGKAKDAQASTTAPGDKPAASEEPKRATDENPTTDADIEMKDVEEPTEKAPEAAGSSEAPKAGAQTGADSPAEDEKPAAIAAGGEGKPAENAEGDSAAVPAVDSTPANKNRRKSAVASTGKKLNKKQSKAKIQHLDAKPGDHFFARLKGFPPWPVIVCDEEMLPQSMLKTRPVTAARTDGTYRDAYADGGKKVGERSYPVMYLQTNEFSWTRNTDLDDLDPEVVADLVGPKMRKDLAAAHHLAAEQNNIDHYKSVLFEFQEAKLAEQEAKEARARAKKEKANKKSEPKIVEDEDIEMADTDAQEGEESDGKKSAKKRKAEDEGPTPQRSDSVKKPKIKLTNSGTPKTASNGTESPKESAAKTSKAKPKTSKPAKEKEADGEKAKKEAPLPPKEPELTPEEKHERKKKEILFLRHRLQKGLLGKDTGIKESDMQNMSDYLAKLEGFPDLEASIIRATKINKVLKAMLKIPEIPKESEHSFKPRSQTLLDKWGRILATEPPAGESTAPANGVNGTSGEVKAAGETTNGVNGNAETKEAAKDEKPASKQQANEAPKPEEKTEAAPASKKPAEDKTTPADPPTAESAA